LYFILTRYKRIWESFSKSYLRQKFKSNQLFSGGEYIAPYNETAINISSTLLPKTSVCIHGNHTYSVGEKVIRNCEEKCICSESEITNCQPLCISPYVKAGRELKDHLCQEKLVTEEPCCAFILCSTDSGMFLYILKIW